MTKTKAVPQRIADDRVIVGAMYAPFCRTEGPDISEWPADIAKMKALGYTCLHGFCEWSRIETSKGVYDFSQIDVLLDLCKKNGILAILNVATQNTVGYHMPAWMENEYSGRGCVDIDDHGVALKSIHNIPCLDDPWYLALAERFLCALAERYKGDERVAGWVIWGEPFLYGEHEKPICFCEHTQARFRAWVERKYGTIDRLNKAWGTEGPVDFADFASVRPPRGPSGHRGGYAAWNDWSRFMASNFAKNIKWADSLLKKGGATQPTLIEMSTLPSENDGLENDVWELGRSADIVGVSCFLRPSSKMELSLTVAASIAACEGKSFFVVEQTGGSRAYNYDHNTPNNEELLSEVTMAAGLGAKGVMYWCWRPRFTDFEAGTHGMCRADGKPLPRAIAAGRHAADVAALGRRLSDAERRPQVAILHSGATFSAADGVAAQVVDGECGAMQLFLDARVTPQIVSAEMVCTGLDPSLRALVLPFAYALDQAVCDGVRRFVEQGGCVIADHNLAFKQSDGRAWRMLPGGGLDKVFGFEKDEDQFLDHKCLLPQDNPYGVAVKGFLDLVSPTTAEVLEQDGGRPLILRNRFGKGEAYAFAFSAFPEYARAGGNVPLRKFVMRILEPCGVRPFVRIQGGDDLPEPPIRVSRLVRQDGSMVLTFTNPGWDARDVEAVVPGAAAVSPFLCGDVVVEAVGATAAFSLEPWQSIMLEAT
ncbi:MAG: beta-galactosidase [Kiritimatiellia bacterium]